MPTTLAAREAIVRGCFFHPGVDAASVMSAFRRGRSMYHHTILDHEDMLQAAAPVVHVGRLLAGGVDIVTLVDGAPLPASDQHLHEYLRPAGCTPADGLRGCIARAIDDTQTNGGSYVRGDPFFNSFGTTVASPLEGLYRSREQNGVFGRGTDVERYVFRQEFCLQAGCHVTAGHVDHQAVLAYMPAYCVGAVKLWAIAGPESAKSVLGRGPMSAADSFMRTATCSDAVVLVLLPGDVLVQPANAWHSVSTGYRHGTPMDRQYAVIGGVVFMRRSDVRASYRYATQGLCASRILSSTNTAPFRFTVLQPFWELFHEGEAYDDNKALTRLRKHLCEADPTFAMAHEKGSKRKRNADERKARMARVRLAKPGQQGS